MPSVIIDCPACSRKLRVPDELSGRAVKCPTCEHIFPAPTPGSPAPASAAPAAEAAPVALVNVDLQESDEKDERPWEDSGQFQGRRDAEPHRGNLVLTLGIISIVLVLFCGALGLPLGIAAWVMGRRDLVKIRQNLMDREGEGLTQAGLICGIIGTILDSLWLLACLIYVGFMFTVVASIRRAPPPPPIAPPVPVRPAPVLPPGNKAAGHYWPERLQAYLPTKG